MTVRHYCTTCHRVHDYRRQQAAPLEPRPWWPDVRDILLSSLTGIGVVLGLVWWWTL